MPVLLLASGSPRRRQFLTELGFQFSVVPSNADETAQAGEEALAYAQRVARVKSEHAAGSVPGAVVLSADTIVTIDGRILGKPSDQAHFARMMQALSGRTHEVITAVVARVVGGASYERAVTTQVTFRALGADEIDWYWSTNEPRDKAGGYAIQGVGGAFVARIEGSHSNVIGLPVPETLELLEMAGIRPPWASRA